jgi:hypothetical protein
MEKFDRLKTKNPNLPLFHIQETAFKDYGKIINGYDFTELENYINTLAVPEDGNVYVASDKAMEKMAVKRITEANFYGGMEIQIGYCNGNNSHLGGLEYHKGSEINVAVSDMILLLGKVQDIDRNQYRAEKIKAFYIPKGTALELYQTTLHFAPCKVTDEGFRCVVILPKGTNTPLEGHVEKVDEEDELLFMKNKWLMAHPERKPLIEKGANAGIVGKNVKVNYIITAMKSIK